MMDDQLLLDRLNATDEAVARLCERLDAYSVPDLDGLLSTIAALQGSVTECRIAMENRVDQDLALQAQVARLEERLILLDGTVSGLVQPPPEPEVIEEEVVVSEVEEIEVPNPSKPVGARKRSLTVWEGLLGAR